MVPGVMQIKQPEMFLCYVNRITFPVEKVEIVDFTIWGKFGYTAQSKNTMDNDSIIKLSNISW